MAKRLDGDNAHLRCPICGTNYAGNVPGMDGLYLRVGSRCDDLSQGQERNCVGLLMLERDCNRAEWRFGYIDADSDPRVAAIRRELPVNGRRVRGAWGQLRQA